MRINAISALGGAACALSTLFGCAGPVDVSDVGLPPDTKIVAPGPDVPKDVAFYSGKWVGSWDGRLPTILVVERLTPTSATVVYAWGNSPASGIKPGWSRGEATVSSGVLVFSAPTGFMVARYTPKSDGTMTATYSNKNSSGTSVAVMSKAPN